MVLPAARTVHLSHSADVVVARRIAGELALSIGFDELRSAELVLVVSELASNVVKHAGSGILTLEPWQRDGAAGLQITSEDKGPGIRDPDGATADGFSTAGTLGAGLGAVHRLMDEFRILSDPTKGPGTRIECSKRVASAAHAVVASPLDIGVASRPHPGMRLNGDAFVVRTWNERALVAVIDGLGHGPHAHLAAQKARSYIENHSRLSLKELFRGVGCECRATRGVVMALARIDWADERLTFASVGNIESRVFGHPDPCRFVVRRGVIGKNAPAPVVTEMPWCPGRDTIVLFSDGISSRWSLGDLPGTLMQSAQGVALALLRHLGRIHDDATVLVVKGVGV